VNQGKRKISTIDPAILARLREEYQNAERKPKHIGELAKKVHSMDGFKFLCQFPDDSVDLIFTDEPYAVAKTVIVFKSRNPMASDFDWDGDLPMHLLTPWVYEAARVLKPGGTLINCGIVEWSTTFGDVVHDAGLVMRTHKPWVKLNPSPQIRKRNYRSSFEMVFIATKGESAVFNFQEQQEMRNWDIETMCPNCGASVPMIHSNAYTSPKWMQQVQEWPDFEISYINSEKGRVHETQKPEWLVTKYLLIHSKENDVVVDPYCGSGIIPYIASCLGRNPIENDRDKYWSRFTESRLKNIQPHMK